jgi:hypothetical protein
VDDRLEVYRDPVAYSATPFGWRYASIARLGSRDRVSPLAAHRAEIAVADLLPSQL